MCFEVKITDVFHLSSRFTVFVGPVIGANELIKSGQKVKLLIDGSYVQNLKTHGEWIGSPKHPKGYRSISTLDSVSLTSDFVKAHDCTLVGIS
ncbi:hypothetical protein TUMEXPCC7403_02230 [Tumidithrix helvetica PCC 7403]|uniref:hypothetical protein n=1 Tax=Tumidithrix helvetica TaxID=3457545 RepID=UPI003CB8B2DB